MKVSILIPQLFYDLIGRIIPGAILLSIGCITLFGNEQGYNILSNWSFHSENQISTSLILTGNVVISYLSGLLLGGLWFRVYRLGLMSVDPSYEKYRFKLFKGFAGSGEIILQNVYEGGNRRNENAPFAYF